SALNIFSGNLNHRKDSLYSQKPAKGIIFLQKNPSSRNWLKPENLNKYCFLVLHTISFVV
ncbi:hypothetical protein KJ657_03235, partial [Patescibacteria group bacterium]|nr:hypothetical protein [Patescibacteria group bacterium]